jgi:hypothetical protein
VPAFADFAGDWRLARDITAPDGTPQGRFDGVARFVPVAGGYAYAEEGTLVLPGAAPMRAERRYRWRAEGGRIAVCFADGRAFHALDPGAVAEAEHWCDPDTYRVAYDFTLWPLWTATWRVTGPRKDYISVTTYRR